MKFYIITIILILCLPIITQNVWLHYVSAESLQQNTNDGEKVNAITNKKVYGYGETIHLTINDTNYGPSMEITNFKPSYSVSPCGLNYLDFFFLRGNFTAISNYDDLQGVGTNALNVINKTPEIAMHCVQKIVKINHVTIIANSSNATITASLPQNNTITYKEYLATIYDVTNVYGKDIYKPISPTQTTIYRESKLLDPGNYTIIAFTLSGQISKPVLIQILNSTNNDISNASVPEFGVFPVLILTSALGGIVVLALRKNNFYTVFKHQKSLNQFGSAQ